MLTHDEAQRDAAIAAADQGDVNWRHTNLNNAIGSNLRLSDLAAALGNAELDQFDERWERKRRAYSILSEHLGERLFRAADGDAAMQHIIFVERPDDVVAQLKSQGILAARQYRPMYHHPPYQGLRDRDFAASEFWFGHSVYLPFGVGLTEQGADRIGLAVQRLNCRFVSPASG